MTDDITALVAAALHDSAPEFCDPFTTPEQEPGWPGGHPFSMHNSQAASLLAALAAEGLTVAPVGGLEVVPWPIDCDGVAKMYDDSGWRAWKWDGPTSSIEGHGITAAAALLSLAARLRASGETDREEPA